MERSGIVPDQIPLPLDTKAMCNLRSDITPTRYDSVPDMISSRKDRQYLHTEL